MLAKTQEEKCCGYSGSLRTYTASKSVPDMNSGPEGGVVETSGNELLELLYIQIHTDLLVEGVERLSRERKTFEKGKS